MEKKIAKAVEGQAVAVPQPVLLTPTDTIIEVAKRAEQRIEAVKKIKQLALKITNNNDWVNEGGKPYLQGSGAEKVGRLFGVNWQISPDPVLDTAPDGHFQYTYEGTFTVGLASITAIGIRGSRSPWFSRKPKKDKNGKVIYENGEKVKEDISPEEIDKANVMKSAHTNCIANGVCRILGIRGFTMEELAQVGIYPGSKVEFKKGGSPAPKTTGGNGNRKATEKQVDLIEKTAKKKGLPEDAVANHLEMEGVKDIKDLPIGEVNKLLEWIEEKAKEMKEAEGKEGLV